MSVKRILALMVVYAITCIAWLVLGGITHSRTTTQRVDLRDQVASLWGEEHTQGAPALAFRAIVPSVRSASDSVTISPEEATALGLAFPPPEEKKSDVAKTDEKNDSDVERELLWVEKRAASSVALASSTIDTKLGSDPRRKGLVWYNLYDVWFSGDYVYKHEDAHAGYLDLNLALPTSDAIYDGLVFRVNGEDRRAALNPAEGRFSVTLRVVPGDEVTFRVAYRSRGAEAWRYEPGSGVQQLENFKMTMSTDFSEIDFPTQTLSPTHKQKTSEGWRLSWDFASTVTGHGMGMVMPSHIQPGELSSELILSAPISLLFFFIMLFVVATLQKREIHPINYLFLAAAFFAFHLLFSYSVDHIAVPWAFGISSVVSLLLVVSYLRLVVSSKFALREAALGQLVYLIGFSLAHFWEGYTGLTVTVMAILTLFVLMQATGRLKWAEVFKARPMPSPVSGGPSADNPAVESQPA